MLIKCSECGQMVSDRAECCPNCGYSLRPDEQSFQPSKSSGWQKVVAVSLFVLAALCVVISAMTILENADYRRYGYVESFGSVVSNCLIYISVSILLVFFAFYLLKKAINSTLKGFWIISVIVILCFGAFWIFIANDTKLMNAINQQEEIEKYAGKERIVKNTFLGVKLGIPINEAIHILQTQGYNTRKTDTNKYEIINTSNLPNEMKGFHIICYNDCVYEIELNFDKDVAQSISDKYPVDRHQYLATDFLNHDYYRYETGTHYDDGTTTVKIEGNIVRYIDDNLTRIKNDEENSDNDRRRRNAETTAADY